MLKNTVKPMNSGHLRVLKNLSVIKRCPLLGGSLTEIVTYITKHFAHYSRHVGYLGCSLLRGFTVVLCALFFSFFKLRYFTGQNEYHPHESQNQPPEVFYKKGVLKNFAKFLNQLSRNYETLHECGTT